MLVLSINYSLQKIVIKADLVGQKCKSEILAAVSKLQGTDLSIHQTMLPVQQSIKADTLIPCVANHPGIKSLDIDAEKCTLTVVGTVDPVCVALRLKKKCFAASIVSVEDDKPKDKDKDPCKEACEKLCKAKCEKITCCKECKEKCEKECKDKCEKACEAWLGKGCCSCGGCKPRSPGFYCNPVPSYPSHYGCPSSYPYYACYEERSPDGACTIQ